MPGTTRVSRHIHASPERVFGLLIDREAVENWQVPDGMSSRVHDFVPRVGGAFRVSLTYNSPDAQGKTNAHTDTYHGRFIELIPGSRVVQVMEFETDDPAMSGAMTVTYTLSPSGNGTDLVAVHEGVPDGVRPDDNEIGWRMSLDKLAALAEAPTRAG